MNNTNPLSAHEEWVKTDEQLPVNQLVVDTLSPNGTIRQELKRSGNLWFVPDGGMYVYYTPYAWKYL